jgi:hypothetical protein
MPDGRATKVAIQQIQKTYTIAAPASATGSNFDANISLFPEMSTLPTPYCQAASTNTGILSGAIVPYVTPNIGLVTISTAPAGQNTWPTAANPVFPNAVINCIDFGTFEPGQKRLISIGIEAHNTTADINKQGAVTVYRQPQTFEECHLNQGTVAMHVTTLSRLPPGSSDLALQLPGSDQWEASEGAYVVGAFDAASNKFEGARWTARSYTPIDPGSANYATIPIVSSATVLNNVGYIAASSGGSPTTLLTAYSSAATVKPIPVDTAGIYFTGLSNTSTIQVNVKLTYEIIPVAENPSFGYAHVAPERDENALALYARVLNELPVGVPVGENASGDFWDGCLSLLSGAASYIPFVGGAVSKGVDKLRDNRNADEKSERRPMTARNYQKGPNKNMKTPEKKGPSLRERKKGSKAQVAKDLAKLSLDELKVGRNSK